ncbi:phage adaptor protein, partial [Herbiconiux daphne]
MALQQINTYADLKEAVKLWLNRKDQATIDMIPMFVNFAEKQFTRLVKLPYYETMVQFNITDTFKFVVIPQDFLSAKHVHVNGVPYNRVDVETFQRVKQKYQKSAEHTIAYDGMTATNAGSTIQTTARLFTRIGEQIHFFPTPAVGDLVEMIYSQDIPEMQFDLDQPYNLLIAPDIMLYLSLRHASTW